MHAVHRETEMNLLSLFKNPEVTETYAAGQTVLAEGSPGDSMYVVLEGEVDIRVGDTLVDTAGPGDIVGEMALIDSTVRSASAVATTECRLAPVNEKRFLFMVTQTPFFALHVMRVLADRLRRMDLKAERE